MLYFFFGKIPAQGKQIKLKIKPTPIDVVEQRLFIVDLEKIYFHRLCAWNSLLCPKASSKDTRSIL